MLKHAPYLLIIIPLYFYIRQARQVNGKIAMTIGHLKKVACQCTRIREIGINFFNHLGYLLT